MVKLNAVPKQLETLIIYYLCRKKYKNSQTMHLYFCFNQYQNYLCNVDLSTLIIHATDLYFCLYDKIGTAKFPLIRPPMVLLESGLNSEKVSLITPIYIVNCILVLKQVVLIKRVVLI